MGYEGEALKRQRPAFRLGPLTVGQSAGVPVVIKPHPSAPESTQGYEVARVTFRVIRNADGSPGPMDDESVAYARLFAASPAMLEAVTLFMRAFPHSEDHALDPDQREAFRAAKAAIALVNRG